MNLENIRIGKRKTIMQFALPAIIAMMMTSLITVVDGFFIGNYVGKEGLAAVNLGLPIIYLFLAVGLMISVGGIAIAGMALGAKDMQKCNDVFNQTMCTVTGITVLLSAVMYLCIEPMLAFLKADAQVAAYFKDYYGILLLQLPIMVINSSFSMFIRGEGNPQYFMKVSMITLGLNALLDYLFVRHIGLGVRGIAVASLIATIVALICVLHYFLRKSTVYKFRRFGFSKETLVKTLLNGSSEFVGEMSLSISMFAYNFVIMKYIGVDGVSAFTIVGYISYIFSMILIGFGQGASPLISFAYGAKEKHLATDVRKLTNQMVFGAGVTTFLLVLLGHKWYGGLFIDNEAVEQMVQSGIVLFAVSFLFSGINTITSFYFTSIGKAKESAIISSSRGFVLLLICIFLLPPLLGMTGIWLAAPITETLTLLLSLFFIASDSRSIKIASLHGT
ncbi:MATE family efflux transporter [Ohessyouella blattaphilus]|uniref:Multidrug export protein MepA n=2 Tax=Ohessyouella blattaphilus TaxID=2949333 RepID=A0ABT1EGB5_9FIRM|nr:MATE family efflux transporter [Ohessyouella blattaphilus]MCP1109739.1 MATE family efflux transporter [Ohessyouella blattaphilus]MCR8563133.1 MATE family efflux transporter [Ohessyouella blattaphilus]